MTTISASTPATSATTGTSAGASPDAQAKLKKVAQNFEAVFLRQMIGSMRSASLGDGVFDNSASEQFRDMGDSKMADQMAGQGALHIADLLVKQLGARLSPTAAAQAGAATTGATAATTTKDKAE